MDEYGVRKYPKDEYYYPLLLFAVIENVMDPQKMDIKQKIIANHQITV